MQRYDFFLNYQTFYKKKFRFEQKFFLRLIYINPKYIYTLLYYMRALHVQYNKRENTPEKKNEYDAKNTLKSLAVCVFLYNFAAKFE